MMAYEEEVVTFKLFAQGIWREYLKLQARGEAVGRLPRSYEECSELLRVLTDWNEPGPEDTKLASLRRHLKEKARDDLIQTADILHLAYRISMSKTRKSAA
jgi:hypothetical protein